MDFAVVNQKNYRYLEYCTRENQRGDCLLRITNNMQQKPSDTSLHQLQCSCPQALALHDRHMIIL